VTTIVLPIHGEKPTPPGSGKMENAPCADAVFMFSENVIWILAVRETPVMLFGGLVPVTVGGALSILKSALDASFAVLLFLSRTSRRTLTVLELIAGTFQL
jgi:hypothetical protein